MSVPTRAWMQMHESVPESKAETVLQRPVIGPNFEVPQVPDSFFTAPPCSFAWHPDLICPRCSPRSHKLTQPANNLSTRVRMQSGQAHVCVHARAQLHVCPIVAWHLVPKAAPKSDGGEPGNEREYSL